MGNNAPQNYDTCGLFITCSLLCLVQIWKKIRHIFCDSTVFCSEMSFVSRKQVSNGFSVLNWRLAFSFLCYKNKLQVSGAFYGAVPDHVKWQWFSKVLLSHLSILIIVTWWCLMYCSMAEFVNYTCKIMFQVSIRNSCHILCTAHHLVLCFVLLELNECLVYSMHVFLKHPPNSKSLKILLH